VTHAWDGLLLIDKPQGPTSHDIVAHVRRSLGGVRVGHTGTLDPPATGLLVLVLGCATRLARFLPSGPKTYTGVFALGLATATDDLSGEVLRRHDGALPTAEAVTAAAAQLVGRQMQVPPAVSAKHVDGKRLYVLARRGRPVAAPPSEVVVERFAIAPTEQRDVWTYEMVVSAGTYVRAAVRDLGEALGCGAAVATLRRTAIGPWRIEDAMSWTERQAEFASTAAPRLVTPDAMPLALGHVTLEHADACRRFAAGASIPRPAGLTGVVPAVAVHAPSGELLGVGSADESCLRPRVVLPSRGEGIG
jgi:tRNA pseudouridine55 synthase